MNLHCSWQCRVEGAALIRFGLGLVVGLYLNMLPAVTAADISAHQRGVLIQGEIQSGDYARLVQFLRQPGNYEPFSRAVFLDSPGGDLVEAMQISNLLEKNHSYTLVMSGALCHNACFVLWMSGVTRYLSERAELGVRRASPKVVGGGDPSTWKYSSVTARRMDSHLSSLGVPPALLRKISATTSSGMFIIRPRWLIEQQLLIATSYRPEFFDAAQVECGGEPFSEIMKSNAPGGDDEYDRWVLRFKHWNGCVNALRGRKQKADRTVVDALIQELILAID